MNIEELKEKRQEYYNTRNELKLLIKEYDNKINHITNEIQSKCKHEWVTETQMYEKNVYCCKCNLTNWDKSKF